MTKVIDLPSTGIDPEIEAQDNFHPDPTGDGMGEVIVPIQIQLTKPE